MKKFVFFLLLGLLIIPLQVYAQSLSELSKQLDEQNLQKAKEMTEGQQQPTPSFQKVDCPLGKIEKAVSGGGVICVDDPEYQTAFSSDENTGYIVVGIIIAIIIIAAIAKSKGSITVGERRGFSTLVKEQVLKRQGHRCNNCNRLLNIVDYDHIDGNRSNNDISNCQALCPNCHAEKSRRTQMGID